VRTFDELVDAIRRGDYDAGKVAEFAARHFAHLDGGSTDRVIDELIIAP
jgi:CDP-glycerol glycerophosphotransferase (TagB/SpsB family)